MKTSDECFKIKEIKRLTTDTSKWLWYCQSNNNDNWIECDSKSIESSYREYLKNKEFKQISISSSLNKIDFEKMTIQERKLRRRPEYEEK